MIGVLLAACLFGADDSIARIRYDATGVWSGFVVSSRLGDNSEILFSIHSWPRFIIVVTKYGMEKTVQPFVRVNGLTIETSFLKEEKDGAITFTEILNAAPAAKFLKAKTIVIVFDKKVIELSNEHIEGMRLLESIARKRIDEEHLKALLRTEDGKGLPVSEVLPKVKKRRL